TTVKAAVSLAPFVKGGRTDPVFTCDFLNAFTSLEFLKDLTDLLRFESFPFHNTLLKLSIIFYSLTVFFSGKLTTQSLQIQDLLYYLSCILQTLKAKMNLKN